MKEHRRIRQSRLSLGFFHQQVKRLSGTAISLELSFLICRRKASDLMISVPTSSFSILSLGAKTFDKYFARRPNL